MKRLLLLFFIFLLPDACLAKPLVATFPIKSFRVIDGDTINAVIEIWINTETTTNIRVLGIDTPEKNGKCKQERTLATRATEMTHDLLTGADTIEIHNIKNDKFGGRINADVIFTRDGRRYNLGTQLIKNNLAIKYTGGKKLKNWCE